MSWFYLIIAGLLEVIWATSMGYSQGFTKLIPSIVTIIGMLFSFFFPSQALKTLPIGTAYAIWTGIGAVGTVIIGIILFHEPITFIRCFFLLLIITGIVGLKLVSPI